MSFRPSFIFLGLAIQVRGTSPNLARQHQLQPEDRDEAAQVEQGRNGWEWHQAAPHDQRISARQLPHVWKKEKDVSLLDPKQFLGTFFEQLIRNFNESFWDMSFFSNVSVMTQSLCVWSTIPWTTWRRRARSRRQRRSQSRRRKQSRRRQEPTLTFSLLRELFCSSFSSSS